MQQPYPRKQILWMRGFTLIELLVVISVISLLVAILLPALAGARESARRIKCLSGVRQVGLFIRLYQDDSDGFFPGTPSFEPNVSGHKILVETGYAPKTLFTNKGGCPYGPSAYSASAGSTAYTPPPVGVTSYGLNDILMRGNGIARETAPSLIYRYNGQQSDRLRRLQQAPDRVIVASCCIVSQLGHTPMRHTIGIENDRIVYIPASRLADNRHNGDGLPAVYYDGHARFLTADEILDFNSNNRAGPWSDMEWSFIGTYYAYGMDY